MGPSREQLRPIGALALAALVVATGGEASGKTQLELVSRASGPSGAPADDASNSPSVSADGRYVAFASRARNLVPDDTDEVSDIYVRDRVSDTTTLVSRASGPTGAKGNLVSIQPSISASGRFVAFTSEADNLTAEGGGAQIYLRDLATDTTTLVSRAPGPVGAPANSTAHGPAISGDGGSVAFVSAATNLDPDASRGTPQIYVRRLTTGATELVSRTSGQNGEPGLETSREPAISDDGNRVAFSSDSANLDRTRSDRVFSAVFVRDLDAETTTLVSRASGRNGRPSGDSSSPAISQDGRRVAFESTTLDLDPRHQHGYIGYKVYVRVLEAGKTKLVSYGIGHPRGDRPDGAFEPSISRNGNLVAFVLTFRERGGEEPRTRYYQGDLKRGETMPVPGAVTQPELGLDPSLSANGNWLAFESTAARLVPEDPDTKLDVFVSRLRH